MQRQAGLSHVRPTAAGKPRTVAIIAAKHLGNTLLTGSGARSMLRLSSTRQAGLSLSDGGMCPSERPSARPGHAASRPPCGAVPRSQTTQGEPDVMTDYDPRKATGIPTEPVGSLPRPTWLQQAYAQYDAGEITREQLEAE